MSSGKIGASFKPGQAKDAQEPGRDESQYGAPFKANEFESGPPVEQPQRDDSQYGAAFTPPGKPQGIPCPGCGSRHYTKTIETRAKGNRIKREKTCKHCARVFTTYEELSKPA